ncbi:Hypothetical predicted protein [Olea europaea subsp. europaea]|uniref:FCP1 homology domain-containing protein n=1 Tax=Olea europaea subsp. europaea TaxID=158383 RepID=A0A8S0SCP5_OLEEU|nr:Hypothetical predicted protein [Olea europaea subsp. europaea]
MEFSRISFMRQMGETLIKSQISESPFPDEKQLLFCWDQESCTRTRFNALENHKKPLFIKELSKVWAFPEAGKYNESNTLLMDDSPYKAVKNPANTAIFPLT